MLDWDHAYTEGTYLSHWHSAQPGPELVATVAALGIPFGGVALDVGCGAGTEALFLASCGFEVIGVDISQKALELAAAREPRARVDWRRGNALALPVEKGTVQLVVDRGCFHHVHEAERQQYANEIHRVLAPGGHFLLRGCRLEDAGFVPVTAERIDRVFSPQRFSRGPVLPLALRSDTGTLDAHLVLFRRQ